jgi:hypothetical protein
MSRISGPRIRWVLVLLVGLVMWPASPGPQADRHSAPVADGRSVTQMADGRWLIVGGLRPEGAVGTVVVEDRQRGTTSTLPSLQHPRAWHAATVLPNGAVLVFGGVGADGRRLGAPEMLDPDTLARTSPTLGGPDAALPA